MIINTLALKGNFGYDNVDIVTPGDVWRFAIYDRMNSVDLLIKMPSLARNLIDTNAVQKNHRRFDQRLAGHAGLAAACSRAVGRNL